jgi:hypothetical protein
MSKLRCLVFGMMAAGAISPASAMPNCTDYFPNPDGSWSPTHPILVASPSSQTQLLPSDKLRSDLPGVRGRFSRYLNARCRFVRPSVGPQRIPLNP